MEGSKELCNVERNEGNSVSFSGYRPGKIRKSSSDPNIDSHIAAALDATVSHLYEQGFRYFLSGMAEGFDLMAAQAVLRRKNAGCADIHLVAVVPYARQAERYPPETKEKYHALLSGATECVMMSEHYFRECYYRRNDYLVDRSSVLVCYFDGQSGGTQYTVRRARKRGLSVVNILRDPLPMLL